MLAEHVVPAPHVPQAIVPPHPSEICPQTAPAIAQVLGVQEKMSSVIGMSVVDAVGTPISMRSLSTWLGIPPKASANPPACEPNPHVVPVQMPDDCCWAQGTLSHPALV